MGEGCLRPQLHCYSSAKLRTVKTDNFCDPVAAYCNCPPKIFYFNKIRENQAGKLVAQNLVRTSPYQSAHTSWKDYGGGITAWVMLEYPLSPLGSSEVVA